MMWTSLCIMCALTGTALTADEELLYDWEADELECPDMNAKMMYNPDIPFGVAGRAFLTAPQEVSIKASTIPEAGLGAFALTFIPRNTFLAIYEGEVILHKDFISDYAWTIWRGGEKNLYVDAYDVLTSNWVRYVNCSRRRSEENVIMLQCYDKPYYVTSRDVYPGQELLVYYGNNYARDLGINTKAYATT